MDGGQYKLAEMIFFFLVTLCQDLLGFMIRQKKITARGGALFPKHIYMKNVFLSEPTASVSIELSRIVAFKNNYSSYHDS